MNKTVEFSPKALKLSGPRPPQSWSTAWTITFRQFSRQKAAVVAGAVVTLFMLVGILAPFFWPGDPLSGNTAERLQSPSAAHLFGTDELGRDLLTRIAFGASMSLRIQVGALAIGLGIGGTLGFIAGYRGDWVDELTMRVMDVLLAFPGIFLSIAVIAAIGTGMMSVTYAVGIALIPSFARLARSCAMSCRVLDYVEAARATGANDVRILTRHILPNSLPPMIVYTTLILAYILLAASGLSYVGLGVQPPDPEWGAMLSNSRSYLLTAPHTTVIPGIAIMLVALAFNILGDGLRDALDPRLRGAI